MNIVVDAMGSDTHPLPDVEGAILAAESTGAQITLVGDTTQIKAELAKYQTAHLSIEIVHAPENITMEDTPSQILRTKKQSSMHIGLALLQNHGADAFVTAGNTGAALAIAMLYAPKLIPRIKRPALTAIFPNLAGITIAADIGANTECQPEYLLQFANMATIYATNVLHIPSSRVALLSNGEEANKGNTLIKEANKLFHTTPNLNFIGNVEPKEVLQGHTDIVIHDGFAGNIFIKTIEATADMLLHLIKQEISATPQTAIGGFLAKPAFRRVMKQIDPFEIGGAPLLGINGVVIIAHGRSNARAVKNAIIQAHQAVLGNIIAAITQ